MNDPFKFLISGHDTVECAYYLACRGDCAIDFAQLAVDKERLRLDKSRTPKMIRLGQTDFLLHPYGSKSGYSFVIESPDLVVSFGEFMSPSFFVKFKCMALWQKGVASLHEQFMEWADSVGLYAYRA